MAETSIFTTTGRRKTSVARINLKAGKGTLTVNHKAADEYFVTPEQRIALRLPLTVTDSVKKFDIQIRAEGGGLQGQAGAASLAIARALVQVDKELRPALKVKGLLTRDSRMKERKKSGQPGARKRFQFSKR
ncbi:MAG: 30S ribosomal protein S9 [Verrucomicrobiales bacterium]|jgi:small subunit ribosomal protein S9|nr:30S ribosomal protein S9 [Verrucomicrobiales bacterium]